MQQAESRTAAFGLWADPVLVLGLVALWVTLAVVFHGEPDIDKAVSALFFNPTACPEDSTKAICGFFPASYSAFWTVTRQVFHYAPAAAAAVVAALLARDLDAGHRFSEPRPLYSITALAAFVAGPGLLVNVFLKDYWGRPRPGGTDIFGGDLPFVPAAQWSDACDSNCSFVSGEASAIFWLVCLIPLLPPSWRRSGGVVIVVIATFTAGLRVAFGGHYLSDVVLGGLSTLVVFAVLALLAATFVRTPARA
jgi:membrane-associated phospholipid phosphatase